MAYQNVTNIAGCPIGVLISLEPVLRLVASAAFEEANTWTVQYNSMIQYCSVEMETLANRSFT